MRLLCAALGVEHPLEEKCPGEEPNHMQCWVLQLRVRPEVAILMRQRPHAGCAVGAFGGAP
eukprot:4604361-Pyramimonas_sp.AAC.1